MFGVDKYSLISFAPSIAVVAVCVGLVFVGARFLKKHMALDAAKAQARNAE